MPLDPDTATVLEQIATLGQPPVEEMGVEEARNAYRVIGGLSTRPASVLTEDRAVPGPAGDLPLRAYRPSSPAGGALVFVHGGGWTIGDIDTHDGPCGIIAEVASCVVVSVDYRLAPEHRFPAALDDVEAAVRWVVDHAADLDVAPDRIAVGGDSAGGNLAAVTAIRARDQGELRLAAQLLIYPCLDARLERPSTVENARGYFLETTSMRWFWSNYAGDADPADPDISPTEAADLSGLPPAIVATAGFDPLRDEGDAYAQRLGEAGVAVRHLRYDDLTHMFIQLTEVSARCREATDEIGRELGKILNG